MDGIFILKASTPEEMAGLRVLRLEVFVQEQGVLEKEEMGSFDQTAVYAVAWDGREVVTTGRLVLLAGAEVQIGRMAVRESLRRCGIGGASAATSCDSWSAKPKPVVCGGFSYTPRPMWCPPTVSTAILKRDQHSRRRVSSTSSCARIYHLLKPRSKLMTQDNQYMKPGGDTIYERVGGSAFFVELVERFYQLVEDDPVLRPLYPKDLGPGKVRLAAFLAQLWGGLSQHTLERGYPRLRQRHMPLHIDQNERDAWVAHMLSAVGSMDSPLDEAALVTVYFKNTATLLMNR